MPQKIKIGHRAIGDGEPAFVIAEVAGAHEGDVPTAKRMIEMAAASGVDAIKFQVFRTDELAVPQHPKYKSYQGVELTPEQWLEILGCARSFPPLFLADVFDLPSLELMDRPEVQGYKIHLTNIAHPDMLSAMARTGKPLFLSVGGALRPEIEFAIDILKANGNANIVLMHGYQGYPTKLEEVNFRFMCHLREVFGTPVGFLDHVDGGTEMAMVVPIVSLAFGACVIEKHFTLDRGKKGRDYYSSLEPAELKQLMKNIREIEKTFGSSGFELSPEERKYRHEVMKNIVARGPIRQGDKISPQALAFKRSEPGLPPSEAPKIAGRIAAKAIDKDETITWDKVL